ncbi:MAG TPA: carbohydrate-binding domain-containing protein, partial [Lentimicrobium sp.]|nr:carbohydrate-binding domain-containing protein [Lentimicrobium sp.]
MKKISVALLLISIALLFTGCMGGGGSSSITATGLTATTQNLSLNADFSNETTALNLRASSIDTNSFKFRVKALNNGEPAGSWQEVTANYGTNGLFNAQLSVENNYTEFLTEFLYPDGSIMLANLQNVVSASGTAITTNVYTTANRVAFAKWKNTKNPTVKTYSSFLQNLNANDMMAIDSVARLFSDNLKEYFSYVSGESSNTVITFLNEWSTSTSFSTNANNALSQLDAIVARIGTDITTAPPTNGPTVPPGSTTNSGEFVPTISYWEAISGADSTLSAAGRVPSYIFSANDTNTSYDAGFSTAIALNHDLTQITGSGATYSNGIVTISAAGTYVLSGELNGHIFISGKIPEGVNLVLNGVTINGQTHAAIYSEKKSTPVSILLVSGTNNVLSDASSYTYYEDDEPGACLFAKGDLLIKGSGSLTVNGYADENGIQSKGEGNGLVITGGSITVETRSNGIKAKKIAISGGNFKVTTTNGGECFEATESNIYIAGGI